jgi:hypothetical protein
VIFPGPWIPDTTPELAAAVARHALRHVGVCEDPLNSNRGPVIDGYCKRIGVPFGVPWCAAALTRWFLDAGAAVPAGAAASSCDEWVKWAKAHQLWTQTPAIGHAVVYGQGEDGQHIGVVVMVTPLLLSVEGNRGLEGKVTREGLLVDLGPVNVGWRIGYVRPVKTAA